MNSSAGTVRVTTRAAARVASRLGPLAARAVASLLLLLLLLLHAFGGAQSAAPWRALYSGQVEGPAVTTVTLDLARADDGFAFGRLISGTDTYEGAGSYDEASSSFDLTLVHVAVPMPFSESVAWAQAASALSDPAADGATDDVAEGAADDTTDGATAEAIPDPSDVVRLTGELAVDWADDGATVSVELGRNGGTAEPEVGTLTRLAQYATLQLSEGRIDASTTYPRFSPGPFDVGDALSEGIMGRFWEFVLTGRDTLDKGDGLGWGYTSDSATNVAGFATAPEQAEGDGGAYVSLVTFVHTYLGGAHPNLNSYSQLLRVGDAQEEFALDDLFAADSGWFEHLSGLVTASLAAQGAQWFVAEEGAGGGDEGADGDESDGGNGGDEASGEASIGTPQVTLDVADLRSFSLSAAGMTIYFDPYVAGPYVQGSFRVLVPFEELLAYAVLGGPLEAFAASSR